MASWVRYALFQSTLPVGGATKGVFRCFMTLLFQSTLPVGGATAKRYDAVRVRLISIHAPRGGSDKGSARSPSRSMDFNPRSPWGERPSRDDTPASSLAFQSTLPVGGATILVRRIPSHSVISIHAPRGGSDIYSVLSAPPIWTFQSTLPVGGATKVAGLVYNVVTFQSTLPVGGATGIDG